MELYKKLRQIPSVDWNVAVTMSGGRHDMAAEIFQMLLSTLPGAIAEINQLYNQRHIPELMQKIHKLYGAVCYCGTPRLKIILSYIETQLRTNVTTELLSSLEQLNDEINDLLERQPQN